MIPAPPPTDRQDDAPPDRVPGASGAEVAPAAANDLAASEGAARPPVGDLPPAGQDGQSPEAWSAPPPPRRGGRADARVIVALAGPVLFTPTALIAIDRPLRILEVPAILIYVFAVWLIGIGLTYIFARRTR
ncbi:hypothetical protein DLJ53_23725 [Acuticoccus sediminis]|uniref:DUF3311 domain-containing protein n=1 Tax=Acuticoccus sediminis TaxID=2184697 RepID=A0A8B2NRA0_9HYPH|nr:hypothetical protein [Acuticoccus sediminis]RAH99523.1 hypothetical protein DLJ53_23725 [Acuticoccus sediminis]